MKNSEDYLHHMKFEQEVFNLISGPLFTDLYSFLSSYERSAAGVYDTDFWAILSYFVCRSAALFAFFYTLSNTVQNKKTWLVGYAATFVFYVIGLGLTIVALNSEKVDHIAVRKCTMLSECFSLFWLFLYFIYLYNYIKELKMRVTQKSYKLFEKRAKDAEQITKES